MRHRDPHALLVVEGTWAAIPEMNVAVHSPIQYPHVPSKEILTQIHNRSCRRMFVMVWFATVGSWGHSGCPSPGDAQGNSEGCTP